ncbi:MAG: 50S ribosome-binding GTPase [Magnetococcus sp. WYHC-3]
MSPSPWAALREQWTRLVQTAQEGSGHEASNHQREDLARKVARNACAGAAVDSALDDLRALGQRTGVGHAVQIAFLGEINTGKSALIRSLAPGANPEVTPLGGRQSGVLRYRWHLPEMRELLLVDLPGLNAIGGVGEALARDEVMLAHAVVFVCTGDLTRDQFEVYQQLCLRGKPVVVALNKIDQLEEGDLALLRRHLQERLWGVQPQGASPVLPASVATVSAGGVETVRVVLPDGREVEQDRRVPPRVDELLDALGRHAALDRGLLDRWLESTMLQHAAAKLDRSLEENRKLQIDDIILSHAIRAMERGWLGAPQAGEFALYLDIATELAESLYRLIDIKVSPRLTRRSLVLCDVAVRDGYGALMDGSELLLRQFSVTSGPLRGGLLGCCHGLAMAMTGMSFAAVLDSRGRMLPEAVRDNLIGLLHQDMERIGAHLIHALADAG